MGQPGDRLPFYVDSGRMKHLAQHPYRQAATRQRTEPIRRPNADTAMSRPPGGPLRRDRRGGGALIPLKSKVFRGVGISGVAIFLVGCAATTPRNSPWEAIEPFDDTPPTEPLELPDYPVFRTEGGQVTTTTEGGQILQIYREAAIANTEIAWEHGDQVADLRVAYNALARAGQAEHDLAELRRAMLEEERRGRLMDKLLYGIIALWGIAQ